MSCRSGQALFNQQLIVEIASERAENEPSEVSSTDNRQSCTESTDTVNCAIHCRYTGTNFTGIIPSYGDTSCVSQRVVHALVEVIDDEAVDASPPQS